MAGLSSQEVMVIVNRYIGVNGGYLGDFTYRTHHEFYPEYCGVNYDTDSVEGTTRERFIKLLSGAPPRDQARIVRGVLERFPLEQKDAPATRTKELRQRLEAAANRIERDAAVGTPDPAISSDVLERALSDAETLLETADAGNAVDRVHTALHAYLLALCDAAGLPHSVDGSLTDLFKVLRTSHPQLQEQGPRADDVSKVLRAFAVIVDSLQPVRNMASLAHPNPGLLAYPEAMLVVNATRTLLHYLNARIGAGA